MRQVTQVGFSAHEVGGAGGFSAHGAGGAGGFSAHGAGGAGVLLGP